MGHNYKEILKEEETTLSLYATSQNLEHDIQQQQTNQQRDWVAYTSTF